MTVSPKFVAGMLAGAAAMYFFDPAQGRSRRAKRRDQAAAALRRRRRRTEQRERNEANRHHGEELIEHGGGQFHPVDDTAAAQHLKQVLSRVGVPTADVTVEVVDGVAVLRGQVDSEHDHDVVVTAVCEDRGIRAVENYLHLPGEPAPNKAAALAASGRLPNMPG
jgi:hyperosmotically inducible protein